MTADLSRSTGSLVGRERELAALRQQLKIALRGELRVVFLSGEPGIGKSRLLAQLAAEARIAGATALQGGASLAEGMPPYLPFLIALGPYLRTLSLDWLRSATGDASSMLAGIFPELVRLQGLTPGPALPPEQARWRLFDAVGSFFAALAEPGGLVLCLDDLQWADSATLDLLTSIATHHTTARLLLIGAYREGEAEENEALVRARSELTRQRRLVEVPVRAISHAETEGLAACFLGGPVGPALVDRVHVQSGGNPFFAEELLVGWLEAEALSRVAGRWELASLETAGLPPSILAAVRQRLARLPAATVDLLRMAAIVGRTFSVDLLAEIGDGEPELIEDALQPAIHAGLLRQELDGRFSFGHDTIRECLYGEVSSTRRRRLHGLIGDALAARYDPTGIAAEPAGRPLDGGRPLHGSVSGPVAGLAFHFARSTDVERGIVYSLQAGDRARQTYAHEEALAHYVTAHDLLAPGDPRRPSIQLAIGAVALAAGRVAEAAAAFEGARGALLAVDPPAAARATHGLGVTRWRQDRLEEARVALEAALALFGGDETLESVRVRIDLATVLGVALGRQAEATAHAHRALEAARRLRDNPVAGRGLEAIAAVTMGKLLMRGNDFAHGIPALEEALVLAEAADDPATAAECAANLSNGYFSQGAMERSRHYTYLRLDYAERCRQPHELRHIHGWLALLAIWQGRWAEAEERLAQAQSVVEQLSGDEPLAYLHAMRGCLAYQRGCFAAAVEHLERTVAIHRTKGAAHLTWYEGLLMLALLEMGERGTALACRAELEAAVQSLPVGSVPTAPALTCLIKLSLALGEVERAAGYEPGLRPFSGEMFSLFMVDSALGALETARGNWRSAAEYLQRAESIARANSLHPALADLLALRADLVLRRADENAVREVRPLLDEAAGIFASIEMQHRARPLRERLQHLPQPGRRRRADLPAGLSRREVEVLRLVAGGKSNREIAEALFLSESTVANHLTSIFNKTGAENRAAATAFAIRHEMG